MKTDHREISDPRQRHAGKTPGGAAWLTDRPEVCTGAVLSPRDDLRRHVEGTSPQSSLSLLIQHHVLGEPEICPQTHGLATVVWTNPKSNRRCKVHQYLPTDTWSTEWSVHSANSRTPWVPKSVTNQSTTICRHSIAHKNQSH